MIQKLKSMLNKEFPLYVTIAAIIVWTMAIVWLSLIPTSYTLGAGQKSIVRQNTALQIELIARYDTMDSGKYMLFLKENLRFAILLEEIMCGTVSQSSLEYQKKIQETSNE
jgi:hypothetical protein